MPDINAIIVILTALPVEYEAVKAELVCVRTFRHDSGTRFEEGFLKGTPWRIVIAEMGAGNESAAVIAERAAQMFQPRAVLFTGIAGSLKTDVLPGHVVVATRVHAYQGGRQTEDGLLARPESWEADHGLLQAARTALRPRLDTCHFKAVAAGDVVLDAADTQLRQWLKDKYNDAVAIEMEGAGVAHAAHLGGGRPVLIIRGISDRADGSKSSADADGFQRTAARHAAQATMSVLRVLADELDRWDYCVSYAAEDQRWAEWAAWELRKADGDQCRVLLRRSPSTESEYRAFPLWDGVARADRVLAITSNRYLNSVYRQREWEAAKQADAEALFRKVIPVRTDDGEPPSVLGPVRPVDLRDLAVEAAREALLAGVKEAEAGAPTMRLASFDGAALFSPCAAPPGDGPLPEFPGFPGQVLMQTPVVRSPVPELLEAPVPAPARWSGSVFRGTAVLADGLVGGGRRRLRRAVNRVDATLAFSVLSSAELDRAARHYRRALRLALRLAPGQANQLFETYDQRVPDASYAHAFRPQDEGWLAALAARGDRDALTVVFELAGRLRLSGLQTLARDLLIGHLSRSYDSEMLIRHFDRWRALALLEGAGWGWALQQHAIRVPLERNAALWQTFLGELPEALLPRMFTVHFLLGRGADAATLAVTPEEQRQALDCCLRSKGLHDLQEGLRMARTLHDGQAARTLQRRLGDLLFAAGRHREALLHYQDSGMLERAGECHRLLGRPFEALSGCPDDQPGRLLGLVNACVPLLGDLVARRRYTEAARRAQQLAEALGRVRGMTPAVAACREEIAGRRDAVLRESRNDFETRLRGAAEHDRPAIHADWCGFEEAAGELAAAAAQAEAAGTFYRAHELYRRAGWYSEADRVLHGDLTPRGLTARAAVLTAGGDLPRAAQIREEAGEWEEAIILLLAEKDLGGAIRCLRRKLGDEAVEDPRLAEWLRATGEFEVLVELCLAAVERKGPNTRAVTELRDISGQLRDTASQSDMAPELAARIRNTLDALDAAARRGFEERVPVWIARARREIDGRFASIWGLDLGTSQCAAAIYDTADGRPVACDWKGQDQFPSTLCVDAEGNELVGLTMEQIQTGRAMALIRDAKRRMGTAISFQAFKGRYRYRPEEVAAHLIRHARQIVENFLAARVRDLVAELAQAELDHVPPEWLNWAEQQHSYHLSRPKAIITVPAHFPSKAHSATRDACKIAGVELVRMIHEPTAACLAANFQRKGELRDSVIVVDLGAGTLDISHMDIGDGVHEVKQVFGNNSCGSRDFDPLISQAIARQIERLGFRIPPTAAARRRLEVAAEEIKIALSARQEAEYLLPGFADGQDVQVSLSRDQLADAVSEPIHTLRRFCARIRGRLPDRPDHLVLIGGPMLAPPVSDLFEQAFGLTRTVPGDPRTAVSLGAALAAAQLDGKLPGTLIIDVTPFALGIKAHGKKAEDEFATLIEPNTRIPARRSEIFTTAKDDQTNVSVNIFSGVVSPDTEIGKFALDGIRPARHGTPQIEVSFELDASCVLHVTARDLGTGNKRSIQVNDPTLLTPEQVAEMTDRLRQLTAREQLRRERDEVSDTLDGLVAAVEEFDGTAEWSEFRHRLAAFRTPPELLDAPTQHTLAAMHAEATSAELEFAATRGALQRQGADARALLTSLRSNGATAAMVEQAQDICSRLERTLGELMDRQSKLATWNTVLIRSAVSRQALLTRFRDRHEEGDLSGALSVLEGLSLRLDQVNDIERLLHCIAETGDVRTRADLYRTALADHADLLTVCPLPPAHPEEFPRAIRSALVRILTTAADGTQTRRTGFLLTDRLVATTWQHPVPPEHITVHGDGFLHGPESALVAVLRLDVAVPVAPLRLGHPALIRLGDPVWAPATAANATEWPGTLRSSTVNGLENFPERQLRLIRTSLRPSPDFTGAPLLNGLGEAIGLLCVSDRDPTTRGGFAVSAEALSPVLARAGCHRYR